MEEEINIVTPPQDEEPSVNRFGAIQSALTQESFVGNIAAKASNMVTNFMLDTTFKADPTFDVRDRIIDLQDNGITGNMLSNIMDNAKSEQHYYVLKQQALRDNENAKALDNLGAEGVLYRVGAGMSDMAIPGGVMSVAGKSVDAAISTVAPILKASGFSEKASRTIVSAIGGIGVEVGLEIPKQIDPIGERDGVDLLISAVAGAVGGALYKPAVGTQDFSDAIGTAANAGLELFDDIAQIPDPVIRSRKLAEAKHQTMVNFLESTQFSQEAILSRTGSATLSDLADKLFYNPRVMSVDDYSATEVKGLVTSQINQLKTFEFNNLYSVWYEAQGRTKGLARINAKAQEEFSNWVGKVYYGLDEGTMGAELTGKAKEMLKNIAVGSHEILERNGHPKFKNGDIPIDPEYFPREWKVASVFSDIHAGRFTKKEYRALVATGLRNGLSEAGLEITPEIEKQITERARGFVSSQESSVKLQDGGDFAKYIKTDNRIDSISALFDELLDLSAENSQVMKKDVTAALDEAISLTGDTRSSNKAADLSSRTRRRAAIDIHASIQTASGETISLANFLDTDVSKAYGKYAESMGGDTALQQLGIKSRKDLASYRDTIEKELVGAYGSKDSEKVKNILANIDDVFKQMLGFPTVKDPNGLLQQSVMQANMFVRTTKLGMAWLPMLVEGVKVAHHVGAANFVRSFPDIKQFFKGYGGEMSDRMLEMRAYLGLDTAYRESLSSVYDDLHMLDSSSATSSHSVADKVSSAFNSTTKPTLMGAQEATFQLGGVKSIQGLWETMLASGATARIVKHAQSNTMLDPRIAQEYGWSQNTFKKIADNIRRYGDNTGDTKKDLLNLHMWDSDAQQAYLLGIRRASSVIVQKEVIGDGLGVGLGNNLMKNSPMGQLALSLKGYMLNAYSKQLSRSLYNFDSRVFGEWTGVTATAYMVAVAQAHISSAGDEDALEKALSPDRLIAQTIGNHSASSLLPVFMNGASQLLIDEPIVGDTARGAADLVPSIGAANKILDIPSSGLGLMLDGVTTTDKEVKNAIKAFVPNFLGVNYLASSLGDTLGEEKEDESDENKVATFAKALGISAGALATFKYTRGFHKTLREGQIK